MLHTSEGGCPPRPVVGRCHRKGLEACAESWGSLGERRHATLRWVRPYRRSGLIASCRFAFPRDQRSGRPPNCINQTDEMKSVGRSPLHRVLLPGARVERVAKNTGRHPLRSGDVVGLEDVRVDAGGEIGQAPGRPPRPHGLATVARPPIDPPAQEPGLVNDDGSLCSVCSHGAPCALGLKRG
jgi:hypothetical protein